MIGAGGTVGAIEGVADDIRNRFVTRIVRAIPKPPDPGLQPLSLAEKFAAKRGNEELKTTATLLNNSVIGVIVAGVIAPWAAGRPESTGATIGLLVVALVLHSVSRVVLRLFLKREE